MTIADIARRAACELPYNGVKDRLVVFTQGNLPTVYATRSGVYGEVTVSLIPPEKIVDTNASGDSFVGGFLAAFAFGRDVARCCEAGNYAAGEVIQHDGCTFPPVPKINL
uniref:Adenosine kinase n=1 Tax=Lygus hesperus TaxID=30085 RepID=A0A0A9XD33_LYGHE